MKTRVAAVGLHIISGKPFAYVLRSDRKGYIRPGKGYHPSYRTARLLCDAVRVAAEQPHTKLVPDIDGWVYVSW